MSVFYFYKNKPITLAEPCDATPTISSGINMARKVAIKSATILNGARIFIFFLKARISDEFISGGGVIV